MVNIFSLSLKNRPEFTLTCQNEVTKAMFNPAYPWIYLPPEKFVTFTKIL